MLPMMASVLDKALLNTSKALSNDERLARFGAAVITHWNEIPAATRAKIIRTADILAGAKPSARGVPERERRLVPELLVA